MEEYQVFQCFELTSSKIGSSSSLLTFDTFDTNADMCFSYHIHVISSIAYSQGDGIRQGIFD